MKTTAPTSLHGQLHLLAYIRYDLCSTYCSPNPPVFSCFLQINRLLTVSFYFLFFYPTSFLPVHHAAILHAVTHDPSISVYGTILRLIFFYLLVEEISRTKNIIRVAPNFGRLRQIRNSAIFPKFGFGQISGRIWQTPMQLQCVQLVT